VALASTTRAARRPANHGTGDLRNTDGAGGISLDRPQRGTDPIPCAAAPPFG